MTTRVKVFSGFERFWHLAQLILIFGLLLTGFNIHGTWSVLAFVQALNVHIVLALCLIGLWVLAIFWHLTTGEWRQYVPTGKGLMPMILYYAYGIFSGEPKPYTMTVQGQAQPLAAPGLLRLQGGHSPGALDLGSAAALLCGAGAARPWPGSCPWPGSPGSTWRLPLP